MNIVSVRGQEPRWASSVFLAEGITLVGNVEIGEDANIWFGSVLRGDVHSIRIGQRTNIQDLTMVHVTEGTASTFVGSDVTVGHRVILHGCSISDRVLVGMGAILLDGVEVESDSMIAAGSLLTPGTKVPSGVMMMGAPAKVKRELTAEEIQGIRESAKHYVDLSKEYM